MENSDKPAFAIAQGSGTPKEFLEQNMFGLTKREYFAAIAIQGLILRPDFDALHDYRHLESSEDYLKRKVNTALIIADYTLSSLSHKQEEK